MTESQTSFADLIGDVGAKTAALARAEMSLFGAEMRAKLSSGVNGSVWLAAGAALLLAAFALAVTALLLLLISLGLKAHIAAAILALAMAVLGALVLRHGLTRMRNLTAAPERTLAQLRNDAGILNRSGRNA